MTIAPLSAPSSSGPSLEAFASAASVGDAVHVSVSGQSMQVLGTGSTPGGRSVAWVAPDVDTTAMFTNALARTHGQGVAIAVARELGLQPSPGTPLASRVVSQALDMAQTTRAALEGVDFFTQMLCSARSGGPAFQQACQATGVASADVGQAQRQQIDQAMQSRFEQAAAQGQSPVSPGTAQQWLRELLSSA